MGWAIYEVNGRDCGYSVPAPCDSPDCDEKIDRGLAYVCGTMPGGGEGGCGLYFCPNHGGGYSDTLCTRCENHQPPYEPRPDIQAWIDWKMTDDSWAGWRAEHPEWVAEHTHDAPHV